MAAGILDGKALAGRIKAELRQKVEGLKAKGVEPCLAVILLGQDAPSLSYVNSKERDCAEIGVKSLDYRFPQGLSQERLLSLVAELNARSDVDGILVQLPLGEGIDERRVISAIDSAKDVDGFSPINVGKMALGQECFLPCTPHGVIKLIQMSQIPTSGAHAVVVGRSNIVGRPLSILLSRREYNATVTLCHTGTRDLAAQVGRADILVACAGSPGLIHGDMIKSGAIVIDVAMNRVDDPSQARGYRLVGDVDFPSASAKASWITPVPGGVGPMTRAMLMANTVESARRRL